MAQKLTSLLVALMLFMGPALCIGGLMEHGCDCGEAETEVHCGHEDSCCGDPCDLLLVPRDPSERSPFDIQLTWVHATSVNWDTELASARWSWSLRLPRPPDRYNLPYPQSDRPRLI